VPARWSPRRGRRDRVAVLGTKQVDTVVALLAAASAGAAYVPLDPRLPPERQCR